MESKDFINNYRKIKLKYICRKVKVNYSNVLNGRASEKCYDKVKKELDNEIINLYRSSNE